MRMLILTVLPTIVGCGAGSDTTLEPIAPVVEAPTLIVEPVVDAGVDNSPYELTTISINNQYNPIAKWMDSYSIVADNGKEYCFIDSTLDHNIGESSFDLPEGGTIKVADARDRQTTHPFYRERTDGIDPIYNDIQCGNGPANNFGDEDVDQCPGRIDMGRGGCGIQGPRFTFVE